MPAVRPLIDTDPEKTRERLRALKAYFDEHVFDSGENIFLCNGYQNGCKSSLAGTCPSGDLYKGQLHHVGDHYDTFVDGKPLRVLVLGMSYGSKQEYYTLAKRKEMITDNGLDLRARRASDDAGRASDGARARNPQMSGTTYALRIVHRLGLDDVSRETEYLRTSKMSAIHLFETFSLANFLLCSATLNDSSKDKSTPEMRANCVLHLRKALEILEPTLVITQVPNDWIVENGLVSEDTEFFPQGGEDVSVKKLLFTARTLVMVRGPHPSRQDWLGYGQSPSNAFLRNLLRPAIERAVQLSFDLC